MSWFSVVYGVAMFANEWEMLSRTPRDSTPLSNGETRIDAKQTWPATPMLSAQAKLAQHTISAAGSKSAEASDLQQQCGSDSADTHRELPHGDSLIETVVHVLVGPRVLHLM
jgi:hypothetical protein